MLELIDLLDLGFKIDGTIHREDIMYLLKKEFNHKIHMTVKFSGRGGYNNGSITSVNLNTMEVIMFKDIQLEEFLAITGFKK